MIDLITSPPKLPKKIMYNKEATIFFLHLSLPSIERVAEKSGADRATSRGKPSLGPAASQRPAHECAAQITALYARRLLVFLSSVVILLAAIRMAWTCSGRTNKELIARMVEAKLLKSDRVAAAMGATDRAAYVRYKSDAYVDSPQTIGYGATISAPHMHAHAAENLLSFLFPGAKVLDVGSGSGYTAAIFHRLVCADGTKGSVVGIEHIPELSEWSVANLRADGLGKALEDGEIIMFAGDGRQGSLEHAPFDAIHVGAAAPTIPPALVEQLAKPGRMFIPVGTDEQAIMQVDKDAQGNVTEKRLFGVMYVPLTDRAKQWTGS